MTLGASNIPAATGGAAVRSEFGKTPDGASVEIFTLKNGKGMEARIMTYGATLVSLTAPDKSGKMQDIVLGYDELPGYVAGKSYFGAVVGRYANRIANGTFKLDGKTYHVPVNDGKNSLHGGTRGFDKRVWSVKSADAHSLTLAYLSKDGEEGYPGNLTATVQYTLTDGNELRLDYTATTDKPTVLNLTNHSYFNLANEGEGDILGHEITLVSNEFTPTDAGLIPTGELRKVEGTPFDFRKPHAIGERIHDNDPQLKMAGGYDHNWILSRKGNSLSLAARVYEPKSGRVLEVLTTQPGIQFYTGNFLNGGKGKHGVAYNKNAALCLETQHFPDSPNQPSFPSAVLRPGQTYHETTAFRFTTAAH
jgi:aldose 1-epimerase